MKDVIAAALGITEAAAQDMIDRLNEKGVLIVKSRATNGRGRNIFLDADKLKIADNYAVPCGGQMQARGEAAAKVLLNPVQWFASAAKRPTVHAPLGEKIDVAVTETDDEPLRLLRAPGDPPRPVLKMSAQWHPYYWPAGWAWDHELAEAPGQKIDVEDLRPVSTLITWLHGAQDERRGQDTGGDGNRADDGAPPQGGDAGEATERAEGA